MGWLRTAADTGNGAGIVAATIDRAPELAALRHYPDVVTLRESLEPSPAP